MQTGFEPYFTALLGIGFLLLLVLIQWGIASRCKAGQSGAIPGKPPQNLSHQDFTFRAWRTHQNTLENLGTMLGASFFAILVGAGTGVVAVLVWTMLVARIVHMVLYYAIATEKNPSPRSYFFIIGWLANLGLVIVGIYALLR